MKIVCDACSAKYSIADEKVRGKVFKIRCKKCSNIIVVRGSVGEAEQVAPTYDQKETKVFDYQGYDSPQDAVAGGDGDDAVWHLVIDQEQVGPMTVAEVRERFQRGDIDAESYVWREGFGDWERLVDVDALAAIAGSGAGGVSAMDDAAGVGGLFGGAPIDDVGRNAESDPADLFAARAGDDEVGGDLFAGGFGGGGDVGAAESEGLFAGGGGGAMAAAAGAPARGASASSLTGQRNENSVLFSLNNLAALAGDSPRASSSSTRNAAVTASSGSGEIPIAGGGPPNEGSGLIDIRSMAQVYLGEHKGPTKSIGSGSVDDLPVFSQSSFESASPVLLPSVQPAVNNRLLIALVGLIGVLVIAAVALVMIVLRGGGDAKTVAAVDPPIPAETRPGIPAPSGTTDGVAGTASPPAAAVPEEAAVPAAPTGSDTAPAAPAASKGSDDRKSSDRDRKSDRRSERERERDRKESAGDKPAAVPDRKPPPDPMASSGCDEVTCLVEPDKACCRKGRRGGSGSGGSSSSSVDPSLPERPSRGDVSSGVGKVKGSVNACGSRSPGGGKVTVKIKISPAGSVANASASGSNSSLNSCVESAVKRAKFSKSQLGLTVNYPFVF